MRSGEELARDGTALHELRHATQEHRTNVDQLFRNYESLLSEYEILKGQLEEACQTRDHYKDLASKGSIHAPSSTTEDAAPAKIPKFCAFFKKGFCKWGAHCHYLHLDSDAESSTPTSKALDSVNWRAGNNKDPKTSTSGQAYHNKQRAGNATSIPSADSDKALDFSTLLPQANTILPSTIPLNEKAHRIDAYIPLPPPPVQAAFYARKSLHKLCNAHHLNGYCAKGQACEYDHTFASPTIVACLAYAARTTPCQARGACRSLTCSLGHICQKDDCSKRGGRKFCKLGFAAHQQSWEVVEYVAGVGGEKGTEDSDDNHDNGEGGSGGEDYGDREDDDYPGSGLDKGASDHSDEDSGAADSAIEDLMEFDEPITPPTTTKVRGGTFPLPIRKAPFSHKHAGSESLL